MNVLVVDYGMGNLASVARALEDCRARPLVSDDPERAKEVDRIVLPGVGSFDDAMDNLRARGWHEALQAEVARGTPLLGICLGMQLLADSGTEGRGARGLGLVPGRVVRLESQASRERVPHVGWNAIRVAQSTPLLEGVPDGADVYFVHSYRFVADAPTDVLATTPYCGEFTSVIGRGPVFGTQFHPEKSSKVGRRILANFLAV